MSHAASILKISYMGVHHGFESLIAGLFNQSAASLTAQKHFKPGSMTKRACYKQHTNSLKSGTGEPHRSKSMVLISRSYYINFHFQN